MREMTRKQFLVASAGLVGVGASVACPGGEEEEGGEEELCSATIEGNHGHAVTVPLADVEAGTETEYTLSGSDHQHTLTVTADHFMVLTDTGMVGVPSGPGDEDQHTHLVTLRC